MSQIWIHSDWHRWHENIYTFTYEDADGTTRRVRERFANVQEGDSYIEQRWRELVKPNDHVWCLGDLCMSRDNHRAQEFVKAFKSLPGHKRLILGNHDHLKTKWYIEAGFEKIKGSHLHDGILFSHYPLHESSLFRAKLNAHGHIHQNNSPTPRHYNCCVEVTGYEPIPIETLIKYAKEIQ